MKLKRWFRKHWRHTAFLLLGYAMATVLSYLLFAPATLSEQLYHIGGILQIAGVSWIAWDLVRRPNPRYIIRARSDEHAIAGGHARLGMKYPRGGSIDERLLWLKRQIDALYREDELLRESITKVGQAAESRLQKAIGEIEQRLEELRRQLQDHARGNPPLEWVSFAWLLTGLVLALWPEAVATILGAIPIPDWLVNL